jgi:diguanylate cyclase (GGDEF)-like protein
VADLPAVNGRDWVFDPYGTLIDRIDATIYGSDGTQQRIESGYQRQLPYSLHYGGNIQLEPGVQYRAVVRISSPYYASQPGFRIMDQETYQQHVLRENFLTISALGALICLALYNLFLYLSTKDRSLLYYAMYLAVTFLGWAWTFHIPTALFGWHELRMHYIWFFLIPVTNTLFYLRFLQVPSWSPTLTFISRVNIALSLLFLPSSFLAISYAHTLATIVISIQLILALICGIISWRRGLRSARYFVLAFIALLIPGSFILPANIGLIPDLIENADLLTLLGGTLDGLLLAFALAERIRELQRERDASLARVTQALALANTDSMTGSGNRHAFDSALKAAFERPAPSLEPEQLLLVLIDLDGLKRVNDTQGHARGDEMLRHFAQALRTLETDQISSYRLGGDEFTLIAQRQHEQFLKLEIARIESKMREEGFPEFGASVGVAYGSEHHQPSEVFSRADERMYQHKAARKMQVAGV